MRFPLLIALAILTACANSPKQAVNPAETPVMESPSEGVALQQAAKPKTDLEDFNRQLASLAAQPAPGQTAEPAYEYRLGVGDVITIDAFQVEELRQFKARIEGPGAVALPLLGRVRLAGKTIGEAEQELAQRLGEYLYNPKVSVFVDDYRSQEVTIAGEVNKPGIYPLTRPRSLVELLTLAGGLTANAGLKVNVQIATTDPRTDQQYSQQLLVDLEDLVNNAQARQALILRGGDSIYVPKAGVFFVEGAVNKPGAYPIQGEMNVIKALAMAQGTKWEAAVNDIQIIRRSGAQTQTLSVDLPALRQDRSLDVEIVDGDIMVVGTDSLKFGASLLWQGFTSIFNFGIDVTRRY